MTILVTGSGSGGHITPLFAVATEIKRHLPDVRIIYVGQRGDPFVEVVRAQSVIDGVYTVFAGKFRRYHGEGIKQLFDIPTVAKNIRDAFLVLIGFFESLLLMLRLRPAGLFVKGGYIGVPVGLAAACCRVPYVTHDSDAMAGLANRIIARWARVHAVALPAENYTYPRNKTKTVGVPIAREFTKVSQVAQRAFKKEIGLVDTANLLLVTGGGLGAQALNEATLAVAERLLTVHPELVIIHTTGQKQLTSMQHAYDAGLPAHIRPRVQVYAYLQDLYRYSGAADIVVARAGATNVAELAMQAKATVLVPSPALAGGHQLKNAHAYAEADAAIVLDQQALVAHPVLLEQTVSSLLTEPSRRVALGKALHHFAHQDSAAELAAIIIATITPSPRKNESAGA